MKLSLNANLIQLSVTDSKGHDINRHQIIAGCNSYFCSPLSYEAEYLQLVLYIRENCEWRVGE